jgi:hypothetical protein
VFETTSKEVSFVAPFAIHAKARFCRIVPFLNQDARAYVHVAMTKIFLKMTSRTADET